MLSLLYFFGALASVDFDCERMRLQITCEAVPPQRNRQSFGPVNFARTTTSMKPSCSYASASVDVLGFHYDLLYLPRPNTASQICRVCCTSCVQHVSASPGIG